MTCAALGAAFPATAETRATVEPSASEKQALERIRGTGGGIVWHSNRDGDFEIFRMNADGSDVRQLTQNKAKDYFARWSPDGTLIAFTSERNGPPQVFVMKPDGSEQQPVVKSGRLCSWSPDGKGILWETLSSKGIRLLNLTSGKGEEVLPLDIAQLQGKRLGNASISSDGKHIAFYSNWRGYHSANLVEIDGGNLRMVGKGCEPSWFPDAKHVIHVKAGAQIYRNNLECNRYEPVTHIKRGEGCRDHEYFPAVSNDGQYLVWGICPWNQHDHWTSDYEIFIMRLPDGEAVRLTFHSATDAWPHLFRSTTPPPPWEGHEARRGWQVVTWADPLKLEVKSRELDYGPDEVLELTALPAEDRQKAGKVAVALDVREDLSRIREARIEALNQAETPLSLAAAFRTGAENTYFESTLVTLKPGEQSVRIPVTGGSFKCEATGWKYTDSHPDSLADTRRIILLVYGLSEGRSVLITQLTLR